MTLKSSATKFLPIIFLGFYFLINSRDALAIVLIPLFLKFGGLSKTTIGIILGISYFVGFACFPFWTLIISKSKNRHILLMLILTTNVSLLCLFPLSSNLWFLLILVPVITFFGQPVHPIIDGMISQYTSIEGAKRLKFRNVLIVGSMGYCVMMTLVGVVLKSGILYFLIISFLAILLILTLFPLYSPTKIVTNKKENLVFNMFKSLLKSRPLAIILSEVCIIRITIVFFYMFFPMYFLSLGASTTLLGITMLIGFGSEILFYPFVDKLVARMGTKNSLILVVCITIFRWLILYFITDLYTIMYLQVVNGLATSVLRYSMTRYIFYETARETSSAGKMLLKFSYSDISAILSAIMGAILCDVIGIRNVFLINSYVLFLVLLAVFINGPRRNIYA